MIDDNNARNTTAEGLRRAREIFRGDWDDNGTTAVYLPRAVAEKALADRGWRRGTHRRGPGPWISPSGYREWDTNEALRMAITAETQTASTDA